MPLLASAQKVYHNGVLVDAIYNNGVKVWPAILATTTEILIPDTTIDYGSNYNCTADTTARDGSVQFYKNGAAVGSPVPVNTGGSAIKADVMDVIGTVTWGAEYLGADHYHPSTAPPVAVTGQVATTTVSCSASGSMTEGGTINLSASVRNSNSVNMTAGTVQFSVYSSSSGASANIGGPVGASGSTFTIPWVAGQPYCGSVTFTAHYSGATNINASSGTSGTYTIKQNTILTIYDWWPDNQQITNGQFPDMWYYVRTTDGRPAVPGEVKTHFQAMGGNGTMYYTLDANGYGKANQFAVNNWDPTGPTTFSAHYQGGPGSTSFLDSSASIPFTVY